MACGLPVVTTDVGGNREVVRDEQLGTVVPFGDAAALAGAIATALERTWDRRAIRAYAEQNSWDERIVRLTAAFSPYCREPAGERAMTDLYASSSWQDWVFPCGKARETHHRRCKTPGETQWWLPGKARSAATRAPRQSPAAGRTAGSYYRTCSLLHRLQKAAGDFHRRPAAPRVCSQADHPPAPGSAQGRIGRGAGRFNTGGSSGDTVIFSISRERDQHDVAAKWRATRWWGVDIGDPEIVVWAARSELTAQDRVVANCGISSCGTQPLPAFAMSEASSTDFCRDHSATSARLCVSAALRRSR